MKRSSLRAVSDKRRAKIADRAAIRLAVFERDHWTCQASLIPNLRGYSPCFGNLTVHHILKASQGGEYAASNLATLCQHHNDLIESDANFARLAHHYGLVRHSWDKAPGSSASGPLKRLSPLQLEPVGRGEPPHERGEK